MTHEKSVYEYSTALYLFQAYFDSLNKLLIMFLLLPTITAVSYQANIELTITRNRHLTVEMHDLFVVVFYRGNLISANLSVNKPLLHTDWMFDI